jgi:hypothetical protein
MEGHRRKRSTIDAEKGAIALLEVMEQTDHLSGFDQFRPYVSQHGQLNHIADRWSAFLEALYAHTPRRGWRVGKCYYTIDIAQAARKIGSQHFDHSLRATVMLNEAHSWTKITMPNVPPLAIDTAGVLDARLIDTHSRARIIPYFGHMENPVLHGYPLATARHVYANSVELAPEKEDLYIQLVQQSLADMGIA